jgi:hypothetical protein
MTCGIVRVSRFAEKMKYNGYSAFVLITAHNHRHLWQPEGALLN